MGQRYNINNKSFKFIFTKEEPDYKSYFFDFWYYINAKIPNRSIYLTIFIIKSKKLNLPKFILWPKLDNNIPFTLLYKKLLPKEIYIKEGYLSDYNNINGEDEEKIINLFSHAEINSYFRKKTELYIEGNEDTLGFYIGTNKIPAIMIPSFYENACEIFSIFLKYKS